MFKEGDVVKPTPSARREFPKNRYGDGVGVVCIENVENWGFQYRVKWNNGETYWYNDSHLELLHPFSLENK